MIINFKSSRLVLSVLQRSDERLGISPPYSVSGRAKAECRVIFLMLNSALLVGAVSTTFTESGLTTSFELRYLTNPSYNALKIDLNQHQHP